MSNILLKKIIFKKIVSNVALNPDSWQMCQTLILPAVGKVQLSEVLAKPQKGTRVMTGEAPGWQPHTDPLSLNFMLQQATGTNEYSKEVGHWYTER